MIWLLVCLVIKNRILNELFIRCRKLNIFIFLPWNHILKLQNIKLNTKQFFIMKIPNKQQLDIQILTLKAPRQFVWRLLLKWKMLYTERHAKYQCSLKLLAHINLFYQHSLGYKKSTLLTCNSKQVYVAILKSSKINSFFRTAKPTLAWSFKFL